ncbi:MAG: preprotein translocase subunit SecE [Clostridiales bacterium]|nr:preprotein translocase subunit SecE [Clostridiales bacterium]
MAEENKPAEKKTEAKAEKSAGKNSKSKKPGLGTRFVKFFRDTRGEFKKIVWPTVKAVMRNTGVTLAMCAVLGVVICLFDFGLSSLVNLMLSL